MEPFVGQVSLFAFPFAPRGWAACNGALLPINQHRTLFSLIGNTYGGDGTTTFALPDLRDAAPAGAGSQLRQGARVGLADGGGSVSAVGMNYCIALDGAFPPRS